MTAIPNYVQGGAPGISADRLNQPFNLKTAQYDAGNTRVRCTIGPGRADFGGPYSTGIVEQAADVIYDIPSPQINTTYYVFLTALGFTHDTIGHAKTGIRIARLVMGGTLADPTITDIRGFAPVPPRTVVADWDPGVRNRNSLKVSQRSAGANMTVEVAAGKFVLDTPEGNLALQSDVVQSVSGFTAPAAGQQRYDLVGVRMNSAGFLVFERIAGTPSATPAVPAFPAQELIVGIVGPILSTTTTITNAMISDPYTATGPVERLGVRLIAGFRDRPGHSKDTYCTVADSGWLMEFGQEVSRTVYADLFAELGTQHGAGNGTTTFNLPDSRGRGQVAADNMGGVDAGVLSSSNAIGTKMGEESHVLTLNEMPGHAHTVNPDNTPVVINDPGHYNGLPPDVLSVNQGGGGAYATLTTGGPGFNVDRNIFPRTGVAPTGISASVDIPAFSSAANGGGLAHNNVQPSITVYRMIRT